MRAAFLLAALALNTCTTANVVAPVEIQTVARGSYADAEDRKAVLATSEAELRNQWQALIGTGDIPAVDFDQHVAVFLMGGMRNTGGWSVVPAGARIEGDTAVIDAKVQGPPPGGIVTQAITYPYAVITINNRDVKQVRWD